MGIQDEMYMTQQRVEESLKRNHEEYEVEIEYQRKVAEIQVQLNNVQETYKTGETS